jgi:hypothetical protein
MKSHWCASDRDGDYDEKNRRFQSDPER